MLKTSKDSLAIKVPEKIRPFWREIQMPEKVITEALVLDLVKKHKISAAKGAELLDIPLQDLLELMGTRRIPFTEYKGDELREELKALQKVSTRSK